MVEDVLDLGPPVVVEEAPEPVGRFVDGDAVGEHAVEVDVRVDEAGHDHVVVAPDDVLVGEFREEIVDGFDSLDEPVDHPNAVLA